MGRGAGSGGVGPAGRGRYEDRPSGVARGRLEGLRG